jgi:hypothetical protein
MWQVDGEGSSLLDMVCLTVTLHQVVEVDGPNL